MKRLIRILPIVALLFVSISRMWWRSIGTVAARTMGAQQSGTLTTLYSYDKNGRLTMVYTPNDDAVFYSYDPAGNITAITRPGPVDLLSFNPNSGPVGTTVTFVGIGFAAGVTSVSFNGTPSTSVQFVPATTTSLPEVLATVPTGATTGPIALMTTRGSVTTTPFTVTVAGGGS